MGLTTFSSYVLLVPIILNCSLFIFGMTHHSNPATNLAFNTKNEICQLKGAVFIESVAGLADYSVAILEQEDFADLVVFKEKSKAFCEDAGHWYLTSIRAEADFIIFIERFPERADFSLCYTEYPSLAGCP